MNTTHFLILILLLAPSLSAGVGDPAWPAGFDESATIQLPISTSELVVPYLINLSNFSCDDSDCRVVYLTEKGSYIIPLDENGDNKPELGLFLSTSVRVDKSIFNLSTKNIYFENEEILRSIGPCYQQETEISCEHTEILNITRHYCIYGPLSDQIVAVCSLDVSNPGNLSICVHSYKIKDFDELFSIASIHYNGTQVDFSALQANLPEYGQVYQFGEVPLLGIMLKKGEITYLFVNRANNTIFGRKGVNSSSLFFCTTRSSEHLSVLEDLIFYIFYNKSDEYVLKTFGALEYTKSHPASIIKIEKYMIDYIDPTVANFTPILRKIKDNEGIYTNIRIEFKIKEEYKEKIIQNNQTILPITVIRGDDESSLSFPYDYENGRYMVVIEDYKLDTNAFFYPIDDYWANMTVSGIGFPDGKNVSKPDQLSLYSTELTRQGNALTMKVFPDSFTLFVRFLPIIYVLVYLMIYYWKKAWNYNIWSLNNLITFITGIPMIIGICLEMGTIHNIQGPLSLGHAILALSIFVIVITYLSNRKLSSNKTLPTS